MWAHGADRQLDAELLLHQQQHGSAAPQCKVQLQPLGTVLADQALDVQRLLGCQTAFLADCTPCGFGCQGFEAVFFRHLDGAAHSTLCHHQRNGNIFDGHAALMQSRRLFACLVLSLPRQIAPVFFIHPNKRGVASKKSILNCWMNRLTESDQG